MYLITCAGILLKDSVVDMCGRGEYTPIMRGLRYRVETKPVVVRIIHTQMSLEELHCEFYVSVDCVSHANIHVFMCAHA